MGGASAARGIEGLRPPGSASSAGSSSSSGSGPSFGATSGSSGSGPSFGAASGSGPSGPASETFDSRNLEGLDPVSQKQKILQFVNREGSNVLLEGFFNDSTDNKTLMLIAKLINGKNAKEIKNFNQAFIFFQKKRDIFMYLRNSSDPIDYIKKNVLDIRSNQADEILKKILSKIGQGINECLIPVILKYHQEHSRPSVASSATRYVGPGRVSALKNKVARSVASRPANSDSEEEIRTGKRSKPKERKKSEMDTDSESENEK
jgi:hypothetical protein